MTTALQKEFPFVGQKQATNLVVMHAIATHPREAFAPGEYCSFDEQQEPLRKVFTATQVTFRDFLVNSPPWVVTFTSGVVTFTTPGSDFT